MSIILITGMSGCGKTSVIDELKRQGFHAIETDLDGFTIKQNNEYVWNEDKIIELLKDYENKNLFISGCCSNQGKFYHMFKHVVLFTASLDVMKKRIEKRHDNPYGKNNEDWQEIVENHHNVLPLLKQSSDIIIDTSLFTVIEISEKMSQLI